ncbi:hypothetical protein QTH97_33455 [Variovorax sp. J22R24]|uniref:hypothetical protein n=1 Tax=Variovorax gracilis TaxID=3053502 RepID=UPI002576D3C5|nr:hypothetical protein [Variovorax sp. J22R24]MDM0109862.1 hypothetical protein [Variovorax sp. J22R24]
MPQQRAIRLSRAVLGVTAAPLALTNRSKYFEDDAVLQVVGAFAVESQWSYEVALVSLDPPKPGVIVFTHSPSTGDASFSAFELLCEASTVVRAAHLPSPRLQFEINAVDQRGAAVRLVSNEFALVAGYRHAGLILPPDGIPIVVESAPVDGKWPITTGVPLPLGAVGNPAALGLVDEAGQAVSAQVESIAKWYPSVGAAHSTKWIGLDFVADARKDGPARYFLRSQPAAPPVGQWVWDADDAGNPKALLHAGDPKVITVDTGAIRFTVRTSRFNGVDLLERRVGADWHVISQYGVGPYLEVRGHGDVARTAKDRIRFAAANDPTVQVSIVKQGEVCVVIRAEGDYCFPQDGPPTKWASGESIFEPSDPASVADRKRRHCHFVIDMTAYRGCSQIQIASTLIITYDPGTVFDDAYGIPPEYWVGSRTGEWWKRPIDIGWDWGLVNFQRGYLGYEDAGGSTVWAAEPWTFGATSLHQMASDRCSIVADSFDGLRHDVRRIASGTRSEGWVSADLGKDALTIALKDIWQRFPKELSISRDQAGSRLAVHTWPRHGSGPDDWFHGGELLSNRLGSNIGVVPCKVDDDLLRTRLWTMPFAHQGDAMDLRVPTAIVRRWIDLHSNPRSPEHAWDTDSAIANTLARTAQGIATTTEMAIHVQDGSLTASTDTLQAEARSFAQMWQADVHALASPNWSAATRAEGRFDPVDTGAHPEIEQGMSRANEGWRQGLGGVEGCYGMWIHGAIHDNWITSMLFGDGVQDRCVGVPHLHRIWQASHYRNVWAAWLQYLRSGDPRVRQWAQATSRHYVDAGTIHKDPEPPNGRHAGDLAHCYAMTPWGTPYDPFGHWIDPDAHRMRYCITGDLYAKRLYELWWGALSQTQSALHADLYSRESASNLGAIADYYAFTQDPSALILLRILGERTLATNAPHYDLSPAKLSSHTHAVWNRRWLEQYYDLTGDSRAVQLAVDLVEQRDSTPEVAAFAFLESGSGPNSSTGEPPSAYLERHVGPVWDYAVRVLDTGGSAYHGYGDHISANSHYWIQEWPYFAHALRIAGVSTSAWAGGKFKPPGIVSASAQAPLYQRLAYPYRTHSLGTGTGPQQDWANASYALLVLVDAGFAGPTFKIELQLRGGTNINAIKCRLAVYRYDPLGLVTNPVDRWQLALSTDALTFGSLEAVAVEVPHPTQAESLYQIHLIPENPAPILAPLTNFAEVLELRGKLCGSTNDKPGQWIQSEAVQAFARQSWYLAGAPNTQAPLTIVAQAAKTQAGTPCSVYVSDAAGNSVEPQRVFPPLPPLGPYEYNGRIGPEARADGSLGVSGGLYQLAGYLERDDKAQVAYVVNAVVGAEAQIFSAGTYGPVWRLEGPAERAFLSLAPEHLRTVIGYLERNHVQLFKVP